MERRKKFRLFRQLMLIATIILFIIFAITFFSSYRHYLNIQDRIEYIQNTTYKSFDDHANVLEMYQEAENNFRLFSIDFDEYYYNKYQKSLSKIENHVDSLINSLSENDTIGSKYPEYLDRHKKLTDNFIELRLKIYSLIDLSKGLKSISHYKGYVVDPEESNTSDSTVSKTDSTMVNDKIVVLKKKPLLKRIFDNKADTIKLEEITQIQREKEQITQKFSNELDRSQKGMQKRFDELQNSYANLRKNERDLLQNNTRLLQEVNLIINNIQNQQIKLSKTLNDKETKRSLDMSSAFRVQMIICLTFMFIMICLMMYYLLFASYIERKLINEKSYASQLAQEKTDILAEITHEIRTPINSLIGILDILRKNEVYDKRDKLFLDSAYYNLSHTSKTINDILNIGKLENDTLNVAKFDLKSTLNDIISYFKKQAAQKGLKLQAEINVPDIIESDEFKIRQILTNLISNAIKYSEKGTIKTIIRTYNNRLLITVIDEGIGISQEVQDNLFKKYYTADMKSKASRGIGLGLYITRKTVFNMNGKVSVDSQVGKGSTFYVKIPIVIPTQKQKDKKDFEIDTKTAPNNISNNPKVLIVDDNNLNLLYLKHLLSKHCKVLTAKNGGEALEILNDQLVDIIITDINMPVMSGKELLENLKKNSKYESISVIATSSDETQVYFDTESDATIKFDYILTKPFNEKEINRAICLMIGKNNPQH